MNNNNNNNLSMELVVEIFTYLPVSEYSTLLQLNHQLKVIVSHNPFRERVKDYIQECLNGCEIISSECDDHDDCGTYGYIIYLKNGDIISEDSYSWYLNDYHLYLESCFSSYFNYMEIEREREREKTLLEKID